MKLNFKVFKKGKALYWILGGIFLFVLFYWLINRGGSSGSTGITTINAGQSDAQVAAGAQVQLATIAANTQANNASAQVALAQLSLQGTLAQTAAAADVAKYTAALDAQSQTAYYTAQQNIAALNGQYGLETARVTSETILGQAQIQSDTLTNQMQIQAQMFNQQLAATQQIISTQAQASIYNSLINQISNAKPNDRDNLVALISGEFSGAPISYQDRTSGSFGINGAPVPSNSGGGSGIPIFGALGSIF